jgi:TPR repeat protein
MRLVVVVALSLVVVSCRKPAVVVDAGVVAPSPVPAQPCEALQTCAAACERGDGAACARAATRAFAGLDGPRDLEAGWAFEARACERGVLPSCARLGSSPVVGDAGLSPAVALEKAVAGLPACCASDDAQCCEYAHRLGLDGGFGAQARSMLAMECDGGLSASCNRLGVSLFEGDLGVKDVAGASATLERACTLGLAGACATLGYRLMQGRDVERDVPRGQAFLRRAGVLSGAVTPDAG